MAQRRGVPERWLAVMEPRGMHSARDLARAADVAPSTITRMMAGATMPDDDTLAAVADALAISVTRVRRLVGVPAGEVEPFVLPPEANRLDRRQRAAVVELVRLLAESNVVPLSAAADRTVRSAPGGRGQRVAARREKDPDETGQQ